PDKGTGSAMEVMVGSRMGEGVGEETREGLGHDIRFSPKSAFCFSPTAQITRTITPTRLVVAPETTRKASVKRVERAGAHVNFESTIPTRPTTRRARPDRIRSLYSRSRCKIRSARPQS